jgi:tRNA G18 (ribose-2'-O)-methylase SpoU
MAHICHISSIEDGNLAVYARLTEAQLRNELHPEHGLFIAESPKVIRVAMEAGYVPESILCEERHIEGDARDIVERLDNVTVYTGSRELLAQLTGYTLTRGVLAAMRRPSLPSVQSICEKSRRLCIIDAVCDSTNVGAIFRSAAALGMDGILLTRDSCDPLNRRAVRVSMGTVFLVPWTWIDDIDEVHGFGFKTAAMALTDNSIPLDSPLLRDVERIALIMGTEGDGLPQSVISSADYTVRIPMHHGVDSLNVAAASAVAFWELRKR